MSSRRKAGSRRLLKYFKLPSEHCNHGLGEVVEPIVSEARDVEARGVGLATERLGKARRS
jgi:hypothetical protein